MARDVFDTLAKLIVHHMPIAHVAEDLVVTYVKRYAADIVPSSVTDAVSHVAGAVNVGGGAGAALDLAAKQLGGGKADLGSLVRAGVSLAKEASGGHGGAGPLSIVGDAAKRLAPGGALGTGVFSLAASVADAASRGASPLAAITSELGSWAPAQGPSSVPGSPSSPARGAWRAGGPPRRPSPTLRSSSARGSAPPLRTPRTSSRPTSSSRLDLSPRS